MERSDLRTVAQRRGYDLLYKKKRTKKTFFQTEEDNVSDTEENFELKDQTNLDYIQESEQKKIEPNTGKTSSEQPTLPTIISQKRKPTSSLETIVERPNSHDIHDYFTAPLSKPGFGYEKIIGEPHLGVLLTYALVANLSWGIEGLPGSSKTLHMKKLLPLINNPYVTSQTTESALFNDYERINASDYLVFTELQKAVTKSRSTKVNGIMEIIKDLAEYRDATLKKSIGNSVEEHILYTKPVGYSRATTNAWDADKELKRRMIILFTSSDPEQRKAVNESILSNNHKIWTDIETSDSLKNKLRNYVTHLREIDDVVIFDPYSDCVTDIMPDTVYSTCHIPHYTNMVMASSKFNMYDRQKFKVGNYTYIMTELEDHYTVYNAYHSLFIDVLKELAGEKEMEKFEDLKEPDWEQWFYKGKDFLTAHEDAQLIREKLPEFIDSHMKKQLLDNKIMAFDYISGNKEEIGDYKVGEMSDVRTVSA